MEQARRRQYLQALGIELWERRGAESKSKPAAASTPITHPSADELLAQLDAAAVPATTIPANAGELATMDWDALAARVKDCQICRLRAGCTQTVFGVGAKTARLMVIGEGPGADEDRIGEPFVGRAGQLLDAMLFAINHSRKPEGRQQGVFIANVVKCRPPNNRDPQPDEAAACAPYLLRQIELVQPKLLLAVGRIAAQNLLATDEPIGKLRGRLHHFGAEKIPLIVTYHPAYLLRSPREKARAWDDLRRVRELLGQAA
ncbi:MAG: uracil-DNA glycosylase [Nevskiales bacterium]